MREIHRHFFPHQLTSVKFTEEPKRILDVGCGPGVWVLDMAEDYLNTEIIGTDSKFPSDITRLYPTKDVPFQYDVFSICILE